MRTERLSIADGITPDTPLRLSVAAGEPPAVTALGNRNPAGSLPLLIHVNPLTMRPSDSGNFIRPGLTNVAS
jgi:hypothetical protein